MSVYKVTLKTLSPLHIGDGGELRQDFDFVVYQGRTYRLNEDAVLLAKSERLRPNREGHYPAPGQLLVDADYRRSELFRYSLRGIPRSKKTDARVKSFIKDVYDRPYIPGSSLKGALRTALAWTGWKEVNPALDRSAIGRSRSWAAQPLEKKLFGPNPNHDLLRALHVSDLFGEVEAGGSLLLINAQVLTKRSQGSPIELEALSGDLTFSGSLSIDETLFSTWAEPELHFQNRQHWLDELMTRAQAHSNARIAHLVEWFESADQADAIAVFYRQLAQVKLPSNQALLQIGWGSGWDGKTFWTHLQRNANLFEQLVRDFRLDRAGRGSTRHPGDPFPRSRRAAMTIKDGRPRAVAPFGWVLVEMNP
jgi:CRISPR-associated protein Csm5